ncbi:unnamed protein product [Prorocentrum cordatum]|uniref:Uncharacterized protein n=1 Tax=Prorocentrum cordatum TaxID=2364126 RepID=A0ABN9SF57_9DINO|nr:unnamed protein product [Polarella glacialis]
MGVAFACGGHTFYREAQRLQKWRKKLRAPQAAGLRSSTSNREHSFIHQADFTPRMAEIASGVDPKAAFCWRALTSTSSSGWCSATRYSPLGAPG